MENAEVLKWLLKNFVVISSLKVNFDKSYMFGVNVDEGGLQEIAGKLRYKVGEWPIPYLGMKVGSRINGIVAWKGVVERVKERLKRWDSKSLSLGGRVTIVKYVLNSIPLYSLSFMRMPRTIENRLTSLQRQFLWGGSEGERKIA